MGRKKAPPDWQEGRHEFDVVLPANRTKSGREETVLRARGYAVLYRRRFVPTERGRIVTAFLEAYFEPWIVYGFTTGMEADLDRVAEGAMAYEGVLGSFWGPFDEALGTAAGLARDEVRATVESALERYIFAPSPGSPVERACPSCADGKLRLKFGRHGPFVGCPNYAECNYSRPLGVNPAESGQGSEPVPLGTDPDTGLALTLRRGRYSRYVQLGENDKDGRAPRGTVPASMEPREITQDVARALLAMPRTVGVHPDTGKTTLAGIGLFGSWLKHGAQYVPLPDDEDVLAIGLNRAVTLADARRARAETGLAGQFRTSLGGGAGATVECAKSLDRTALVPGRACLHDLRHGTASRLLAPGLSLMPDPVMLSRHAVRPLSLVPMVYTVVNRSKSIGPRAQSLHLRPRRPSLRHVRASRRLGT